MKVLSSIAKPSIVICKQFVYTKMSLKSELWSGKMKVIFPAECGFLPILCWSVSSSSLPNLISGSGLGNLTRSGKLQRLLSMSEAEDTPPPGTKQSDEYQRLFRLGFGNFILVE